MKAPLSYQNEQELVNALKSKSKDAFSYLYDNYSNALFGVIKRVIDGEEIANDVLQEAFVKIWKNIDSYNASKGTIFTWMLNICRNTAIDEARSKNFRKESQNQNIEDYVSVVDRQNKVEMKIDHIGLKDVVRSLKPEHKILIDKIYFEGYTHDEVSKELEIPLGTVKTRVRAAMLHLRDVMKVKIN
ncbi:MAG: sigma-70 family RNA polymerase sigma factor [Bacteroidota bacterium]